MAEPSRECCCASPSSSPKIRLSKIDHAPAGERGAVLGFWRTVGRFATRAAAPSGVVVEFARQRAKQREHEAALAEEKEQRREQCREAALAGAAKRRKRREAQK